MSDFLPEPLTIVLLSLSTLIFLQEPRSSSLTFSSFIPKSSEITERLVGSEMCIRDRPPASFASLS